MSGKDSKLMEI